MVNWKERGYVPDSDDEDEDVTEESCQPSSHEYQIDSQIGDPVSPPQPSLNSVTACNNEVTSDLSDQGDDFFDFEDSNGENPPIQQQPFTNPTSSTAVRLEAALNRGFQLTHDVLGSRNDLDDATDSPLSSPPSSLPDSPFQDAPDQRTSTLVSVNGDDLDALAAIQNLPSMAPLGRSLRQRAPIQLHPYALEDAKYRQSLKDRGLKPVRTLGTAQAHENNAQSDSQGFETYQSSQVDEPSEQSPSSSPAMLVQDDESQSPVRGTRIPLPPVDLGEDLPELGAILQSRTPQPPGAAKLTRKRLQGTRKARGKPIQNEYRIYDLPDQENESEAALRPTQARFRIPPSPPHSRDDLSSQDGIFVDGDQQLPNDRTPFSLPTPMLSSETRPKRRLPSISTSSPISTSSEESDDSSALAGSDHSNDDSQGVQRMQRKIKGVLPASWLKLDQKKQRNVEKQTQKPSHSPVKSGVEKGVAKRVSGSTTRYAHRGSTRLMLDDLNLYGSSESDSNEPTQLGNSDTVDNDLDLLVEDVVEHNTIDAMLPARSRDHSRRKKQQKLGHMWANTGNASLDSGVHSRIRSGHSEGRKIRSKVSGVSRPHKRLKKLHANPQISLFDAPGFEEAEVPRFLKIAARQKRSNRQSEQDLSTKFFKLATKRDTLDVRAGLVQWKSRHVHRYSTLAPTHEAHSHRAKKDLSAATPNNDDNTHLTLLKQSTEATLKRVRLNQTQRNFSYSQLSSHPRPPSHSLSEYFKPRSALSRRSGLGQPVDPFKRSHTQSESRTYLPNQTTLPCRVPRNTSAARGGHQHSQESIACPISTTRSAQHPRVHRPRQVVSSSPSFITADRHIRKHRPIALMERQSLLSDLDDHDDTMHDSNEIKTSSFHNTSLENFTKGGILSHLMGHAPGNKPLSAEGCLNSSHLWDIGILQRTVESMGDLDRLLEPCDMTTKVTRPESGASATLGKWSSDFQDIMFELCSVVIITTCFDPGAVEIQGLTINSWRDNSPSIGVGCNTTQQYHQLINRCQESLETLIEHINETLWFASHAEIDNFVNCGISMIERVVQEINLQEHARLGTTASHLLDVLNRIIILSYQITQVAEYSGYNELSTKQSRTAHESVTRLAWSISLREDHAGDIFSFLASLTVATASGRTSPGAELETVIIIHQLFPGNFWEVFLNQFLVERFEEPDAFPGEILAYTILILGCVYCLFGIEQEDCEMDVRHTQPAKPSGLVALQTNLPAFLKFYLGTQHKYQSETQRSKTRNVLEAERMNKLAQYGLVAFKWCFLLVSTFSRNNADQLLKKILKCYGDGRMHDFFSREPSHAMPAFLAQQTPPSELVLDYDDKDFHIFLKLVASSLIIRYQPFEVEDSSRLKKLASRKQSLVFSLLPNNAFQVNDDENLTLRDLAAVANRYNLFSTLYHYSPSGYKPPLVNIENLIVFGKSHEAVCNLALQCWATIGRSALAQGESGLDLSELCHWIQDMFLQVTEKLKSIPYSGEGSAYEQRVNSANRETSSGMLCTIAQTWSGVIDLCTTKHQAQLLFNDGADGLRNILHLCGMNTGLPDHVIVQILNVVCSYLKKPSDKQDHSLELWLQGKLQEIISKQFSGHFLPTDDLLIALMDTWYQLAKSLVEYKATSWEAYITPASPLSLDMMIDYPNSTHCITLFLSKALMHKTCFETDPFWHFESWLCSILLPQKYIKFQHILTNRLLEIAPDTLDLADLPVRLNRETSSGAPFDRNVLLKYRLEIVFHIIRSVHKFHNANDDSNTCALSKSQALHLLKSIQRTLRWTWTNDRESRPEWAVFINEVIFEMNLYPVEGLEIDESLTSSEIRQFEDKAVQVRRLFTKAFTLGQTETNAVSDFKRCVQAFREACEIACLTNNFVPLLMHTAATFNAVVGEYVDENGNYLLDIKAQVQFLKAVLPEYIVRAFDDTTPATLFAMPVLDISIGLVAALELRFDFHDVQAMGSFAELTVMLLRASYLALRGEPRKFDDAFAWEKLVILRLIEFVARAATAWGNLKLTYPGSELIASLQTQVQTYVCFVYEYACLFLNLPWEPIDPEYTNNLEPHESRASNDFGFYMPFADPGMTEELQSLREIAAEDLEFAGRWVWRRTHLNQFLGAGWVYNRPGWEYQEVFAVGYEPWQVELLARSGLNQLLKAMIFLGLKEERAWFA